MKNERFHLGVDVAKATLRVALTDADRVVAEADFANDTAGHDALLAWLGRNGDRPRVCLESTGRYGIALTSRLHAAGLHVAVANPRLIRDFAKSLNSRAKTDPVDARIIARYSRERMPLSWSPPESTATALRELYARRDNLMRMSVAERNRLEGASARVRKDIMAHLRWLDAHMTQIDEDVAEQLADAPILAERAKLLRSIPGVGAQTAGRLLALIDIGRFHNARALAAHAGVTPSPFESGSSVHARPHMSKVGHPQLRLALYMPSLSARNGDGFATWTAKLRAAGKPERVILGAVMHRLVRIAYGVLKSGEPYDAAKAFGSS